MSRILVIFGTSDGQTGKIAHFLGDALRREGVGADVVDARAVSPAPDQYDGVIVAASVHAGGYQRCIRRWVRANAPALNQKPAAFVSVCLGVLQREPKVEQELTAIIDRFLNATQWRPVTTTRVAGALMYSRYGWLKRWVMVRIVRKAGGDTDTSRDYEYTNWDEVRAFARMFVDLVRERPGAGGRDATSVAQVA